MVKKTLIDEAGSGLDKVQMRRRAIFWRRNIPSARPLDSISLCITLVRNITPLWFFKFTSRFHFHMPQNWPEDNFDGRDIRFYQRSAPPPDFVSSKRPVEKKSWCWDWPEVGSHFCPIFWWLAIYIIPPADHNARIKRPRYEDIRSVNKSWPIARHKPRNSMRI